jgi:hypothetical protein
MQKRQRHMRRRRKRDGWRKKGEGKAYNREQLLKYEERLREIKEEEERKKHFYEAERKRKRERDARWRLQKCVLIKMGSTVFASFPYKLAMWVRVCPSTYLSIGFWHVSLINWSLLFLIKRKSSYRLLQKRRSGHAGSKTTSLCRISWNLHVDRPNITSMLQFKYKETYPLILRHKKMHC